MPACYKDKRLTNRLFQHKLQIKVKVPASFHLRDFPLFSFSDFPPLEFFSDLLLLDLLDLLDADFSDLLPFSDLPLIFSDLPTAMVGLDVGIIETEGLVETVGLVEIVGLEVGSVGFTVGVFVVTDIFLLLFVSLPDFPLVLELFGPTLALLPTIACALTSP